MLLSESVDRIRLIIRDTNDSAFSDAVIIRIWNAVQNKFALESGLLERAINISVPPTAFYTYTQLWEEDFGARPSNLLFNFMADSSYSQSWEVNTIVGITADTEGGYTCSYGWESFYVETENRVRHYLPDDYIYPVFTAYDEKPIDWISRRELDDGNTAFKTRTGVRPYLYLEDEESNTFYLYPKVTAAYGLTDIDGDYGEIVYDSNDEINPDTDYGVIVFGSSLEIDDNYGLVAQYQTAIDALHFVYVYLPLTVNSGSDEIEWPRWVVKYIEAGVLNWLYGMETDLFDVNLLTFFESKYQMGVKLAQRVKEKSQTLRSYKMEAIEKAKQKIGRRLADLPAHYPSYWR